MAGTDNRDELNPLAMDDLFKDLDAILAQEPAAAGPAESSPGLVLPAAAAGEGADAAETALLDDPLWQELTTVPAESASALAEAAKWQVPVEPEPAMAAADLPSLADLIASPAASADFKATPLPAPRALGPDDIIVDIGGDDPVPVETVPAPALVEAPVAPELPAQPPPAAREFGPDDLIVDTGDGDAPAEPEPAPPAAEIPLSPELHQPSPPVADLIVDTGDDVPPFAPVPAPLPEELPAPPEPPAPPDEAQVLEDLLADFDRAPALAEPVPAEPVPAEPVPPPPVVMPAATVVPLPLPLPELVAPPRPAAEVRTEMMAARTASPRGPRDENDPAEWLNCGNDWRARGAFGRAAECYERVLALDPQSVKAYCNLAGVLFELGERAEAEKYLRAGLKVEPGNQVLKENLAGLRRAERRQRRW